MKSKINWASISLFTLATLAIAGIILLPDYKDTFTALITVSIPTAILSLEMKRNKDQFSASNKLNKIAEIRSQGAHLIEALNQDDLVKLQNDFRFECKRAESSAYFYSKLLMDSIKPLLDKLTIERLKFELLLPKDESCKKLRMEVIEWAKIYEDALLNFQSVICYMSEKSTERMSYSEFDDYYGQDFDLKQWAVDYNNKSTSLFKTNDFDKNKYDKPAFESIAQFGDYILGNPSRIACSSDVQTIVKDIISDYCNAKEKQILNS